MATELFFIYDTHCPWSYATTALVNEVTRALPKIKVHLFHIAHYEGDSHVTKDLLDAVTADSNLSFGESYQQGLSRAKDSGVAANLMAWTQSKAPHAALALLNSLQQAHFQQGNELQSQEDVEGIIKSHKLSPPAKVFNRDKFIKEAELGLHDIEELQEIIGTSAFPALLLANDDNLVLLNHNLYLAKPKAIVEAVELELAK
ncbi:protein disulfide-isomerase [Thalassomonas actiniarum]|uniref:Protein-disulfide isomerase n=1 Tax=Thalassomonas actiniarum TaxID=485447 RepID=A0AAE9YMU8_9GAMM|nr:protein disulfide-isomerase [Thalassomonas actiniarum]WDD97692.1 protein-disulfide isomerase [Thalassomonas actiniarum]